MACQAQQTPKTRTPNQATSAASLQGSIGLINNYLEVLEGGRYVFNVDQYQHTHLGTFEAT